MHLNPSDPGNLYDYDSFKIQMMDSRYLENINITMKVRDLRNSVTNFDGIWSEGTLMSIGSPDPLGH